MTEQIKITSDFKGEIPVTRKTNLEYFWDILYIILGCSITAFAVTSILKPNGLITGGLTGISIILEKIIHIKYSYIYYSLAIIILIITRILLGKKEALKIIILSLLFPLILIFFDNLNYHFIENDILLAAIYFAVINGVGIGLVLKRGFSSGGTDTIAKIIKRKFFPFISLSQILLVIDFLIIVSSIYVFDRNIALYSLINHVITIKVIDTVIFGLGDKLVRVEIISNKNDIINNFINTEINRGTSIYKIQGGYTKEMKDKIICICTPRDSIIIKNFVANEDSSAFIEVFHIVSAWGKGFGNLLEEE